MFNNNLKKNDEICKFYDSNYEDQIYFTNNLTFVDLYNIQNIQSIQEIRNILKKIEQKPNKNLATINKIIEMKNKLDMTEKNNRKHFFINKNT
jgi:50S ribosomal subunit-associated GTPase HflX